jgi:hypothetical protein
MLPGKRIWPTGGSQLPTGTGHLERFLSEQVKSVGGIQRTHSIIALSSAKETREIDTSVIGSG